MTSERPVVSVLMPCYNAAETLDEALTSLHCQTLSNFEIVAIDDGSNDETARILKRWTQKDGRLNILTRPHGGIVTALNTGLQACRGELVARMDSDDRAHPTRLARQVDFLRQHADISVVGCLVEAFPHQQVRQGFRIYLQWLNSLIEDVDIRREIFIESPLAHPSVVFRRNTILRAGGYQEHGWPEDYDLWLRLCLQGEHFGKVEEILLDWREHEGRLTRTDGRYSVENFLRAKAHYLERGPLARREAVIIWGAGMIGRRLSKQLQRQGAPLVAFLDIAPQKIGHRLRGLPILPVEALPAWWEQYRNPALLAAVGARGARQLIREHLSRLGLREGLDWWSTA